MIPCTPITVRSLPIASMRSRRYLVGAGIHAVTQYNIYENKKEDTAAKNSSKRVHKDDEDRNLDTALMRN
jgi:hypothetical protein